MFMNKKTGLAIGTYLTSFLVCILLVSSIVWFAGWHLTPFVFFVSLLLALPVFMLCGVNRREFVAALLFSCGIILLTVLIETFIYDVSYDGNAYHQPMIFALDSGWNPVYDHHNSIITDSWNMNMWIDHYCKGAETIAAAFYSVTGNIESGKALNMLLPIALFFILYSFFRERFVVKLSKRKSILYSLGISFSMITVGQITSYYIDHVGYFTFLLALIGTYEIVDSKGNNKLGYWSLTCSIALAATVKFNMLFWAGFIVACGIVVLLVSKRMKKAVQLAWVSATVALISVVILSFNPFVTNFIDHRNPVYPLFDKSTAAAESPARNAQPPYIYNAPRYKQIVLSYFQRPTNDMSATNYVPPYKITVTNIYRSGYCVTNVGGGGLFFIEIFLMTFIIFISFRGGIYHKRFVIAAVLLISTLFILPMGSVFRYVPFIYLLPFLALLYMETLEKQTISAQVAKYVLAGLLVCNISLCTIVTLGTNYKEQSVTMQRLKAMEGKGGETFYTKNWGFCNKLYQGDMMGREPVDPLLPEDQYEREKFIGGPFVYIIKP
jgi:hypothetical protein